MVRLFATASFLAYVAIGAFTIVQAAPARRQLGDLECNIFRAEIIFHVATLSGVVNTLGNDTATLVAANNTVNDDVSALRSGTEGASTAIKQILLALINGEAADPVLRDQVGGNLTIIEDALDDLSSTDNSTSASLGTAETEFNNAAIAANGVVTNCK